MISLKKQSVLGMPLSEKGFIPTLNQYGYMLETPDEYSQLFIDYVSLVSGLVLDIGAAYGVTTLKALEKGVHVVANDLDQRHLDILWQRTPLDLQPRLILKSGKFPTTVSFPPALFQAILASGVLHYLDGEEFESAIQYIFSLLKSKGKFFFCTSTPYIAIFKGFLPIYKQRKLKNVKWPGLIKNSWRYAPHRKEHIPKKINLLDGDVLESLFLQTGFKIEKKSYVSMINYPLDIQSDGKEYIGFVLSKP